MPGLKKRERKGVRVGERIQHLTYSTEIKRLESFESERLNSEMKGIINQDMTRAKGHPIYCSSSDDRSVQ